MQIYFPLATPLPSLPMLIMEKKWILNGLRTPKEGFFIIPWWMARKLFSLISSIFFATDMKNHAKD